MSVFWLRYLLDCCVEKPCSQVGKQVQGVRSRPETGFRVIGIWLDGKPWQQMKSQGGREGEGMKTWHWAQTEFLGVETWRKGEDKCSISDLCNMVLSKVGRET